MGIKNTPQPVNDFQIVYFHQVALTNTGKQVDREAVHGWITLVVVLACGPDSGRNRVVGVGICK